MREMKPIKYAKGDDAGRVDAGFIYVAKDFHNPKQSRICHQGTKSQRLTKNL
jgi:hypothetical protein